jgi:TRAP-type C4-dicarboxylate transport system substrate-binding protein
MKFYEAAKAVTWTNHLLTFGMVFVNDKKWQSLPPATQDAMTQASKEAGEYYAKLAEDSWKADMPKLEAEKVEFIQADLAPFRTKMAPLAAELEKAGTWPAGIYDKLQTIK